MTAYDYPLLDLFWSFLMVFLFVLWIWILFTVFVDIFRSPDLHGASKAIWFLFVLLIPLVGVLVYLIARGGKMHEHAVQAAQQQDDAFKQYVQQAAGSDGTSADQLAKLAELRQQGVLTQEEFDQQKAKILG
jgi:Short C-terminal domain/Phospholipase_D-nuclease N-terminal